MLASSGIDSTTATALAKSEGFEPCSLTFDCGLTHSCCDPDAQGRACGD